MYRNIIISRTDGIGDVVLTLPMAGVLKQLHPTAKICFIGKSYTQPVVEVCEHVDAFINWDEVSILPYNEQLIFFKNLEADVIVHVFPNREIAKLAFKSDINQRIGTSHRPFHWLYCNKLVGLGRKNSKLHEAQLNIKLLQPLGADTNYSITDIASYCGFTKVQPLDSKYKLLLDTNRFNLILHPKSKGNGREWGLDNFGELIEMLPVAKYKIFISGTSDDRKLLNSLFVKYGDLVTDITGLMNLTSFISFVNAADGLVASGTGPLHLSAALGKITVGLFPPIRPIHPGRWSPIGAKATFLVTIKNCNKCQNTNICECMQSINPKEVVRLLESYQ